MERRSSADSKMISLGGVTTILPIILAGMPRSPGRSNSAPHQWCCGESPLMTHSGHGLSHQQPDTSEDETDAGSTRDKAPADGLLHEHERGNGRDP